MLVLVQFVMVMLMKSEAASADVTVSADSEGTAVLPSGLTLMQSLDDIRWTHRHLVVSLKKNMSRCHHGRCELLSDGSLRFSRVQTEDLGNYSLETFDKHGTRLVKRDFLLTQGGGELSRVNISAAAAESSSSSRVLICCLLILFLLLFIIIIFILRRRIQRTNTAAPREENVYVTMHSHHGNGHHGNRTPDDSGKQEKEEEPVYVSCRPVAMETPVTKSMETEDIYV